MSLVTRCPRCNTLFRVTPTQLQTRAGKVRCGRCMQVFDGFGGLGVEQGSPVGERFDALDALNGRGAPAAGPTVAAVMEPAAVAPPTETPAPAWTAAGSGSSAHGYDGEIAADTEAVRERAQIRSWIAASAALLVVLLLQIGYVYRGELASRFPIVRTVLTAFCDRAGCAVTLPQRPDLMKIEASDVHMIDPSQPGLVQLTATLRSYASFDLAYPALDLVLTNANEHALTRRIFLPDEYLDRTRDPRRGIPAHAEITLALDLDTANLNAAGFRLDLLPAPAP